jgi:hypothetical protein
MRACALPAVRRARSRRSRSGNSFARKSSEVRPSFIFDLTGHVAITRAQQAEFGIAEQTPGLGWSTAYGSTGYQSAAAVA